MRILIAPGEQDSGYETLSCLIIAMNHAYKFELSHPRTHIIASTQPSQHVGETENLIFECPQLLTIGVSCMAVR
jgi:hypothetical protein